ncbi:MAG: tetratricopeptide repeat protein [Lysobacteraceae bacterium]|nr:MAG: tetratricopeptide repeat protein [Xanthomonadaceae bacterium]
MEAGGGYAWRCRAALALAMLGMTGAVNAGSLPECARLPRQSPSETGACLRRWHPGDVSGRSVVEALLAVSDEYQKKEDFAGAEAVLSCAAAQVESEGDLRNRYEVIRRYGLLDYKREDIPKALDRFECALVLATHLGDRAAIAKQLKNAGSARRRLGDYETALELLLRSLEMMRADHDPGIGQVLNNIADLHRDGGRAGQAQEYYRRALDALHRKGDVVEAMHVYVSLADLALKRDDPAAAIGLLQTALDELKNEGAGKYRLLVYAELARAALADGNVGKARAYCADGLALAEHERLSIPWELHLQTARADRLGGQIEAAETRLRSALEASRYGDNVRSQLLTELANVLGVRGERSAEAEMLRQAAEAGLRDARKQADQRLLWLSERFRAVERERENAKLKYENRQRTLMFWLMAASAAIVVMTLIVFYQRRQQKIRMDEAARQARYEEMLARYRREADALSEDRDMLQALLDSRGEALCLLDAEGVVLAVNRAACALLAAGRETMLGRALAELIPHDGAGAMKRALENMEDVNAQTLTFFSCDGASALHAHLTPWESKDGMIVLAIEGESTVGARQDDSHEVPASEAIPPHEPAEAIRLGSDTPGVDETRDEFRKGLVALMLASVEAWERGTGLNRLELAERSRIWRINIDDGRLRARSMERYLSLPRLPRYPRWRDVLRTAYFVLGNSTLHGDNRDDLQRRVDEVLAYTRRSSMV